MAGVEDGDEFRDAEDGPGPVPPPFLSPASTPTKSKPAAAAGGFGRRLLASIGLPTSFSAAIGRPSAPSSSKPPAPQPAAGPSLGLGLLLHQGPDPSSDGSLFSDASTCNLHLRPTADLQKRHEESGVLEEQGAAAQLVLQHGDREDRVIGHDFGVGEELAVLPIEEESREKEDAADGCSGNRNGSSVQDLDREGEHHKSDDLGAAKEDQEVVEQEGASTYYTAVEDQSNSDAELCVGDAPTAIKQESAVEEKKAIEQGCAVGIPVVAEAGAVGGFQEEGDGLVEGQDEDAISVQDQCMVVEQCTNDELGVAMGDSWVHDQEEVVVDEEGVTEYFDAAVEDQSKNAALEQHASDELRAIKDGNVVEEEKAVEQEAAIGILGPTEDRIDVGLREEDVVVEGQGEDGVSVQGQDKMVEHCMSDELREAMGDSAVHDQEVVVVEQAGVVESFDAAMEDQSNNADMEQCIGDELREVKGGNVVEEKVKALEQEGATGMLDAAEDGFPVHEEDVVVEGQGEDEISVQDQHKLAEQCMIDELGVAMGDSTIQDDDLVLDQEEVTEYFDAVVEEHNNYAAVEQCTHGEFKDFRGGNFVEVKEKAVQQECVIGILGVAKDGVAVELQEKKGTSIEGQGEDGIAMRYQYKVEDCTSDELEVTICDSTIQDQEVMVEQEGITGSFDAEAEDHNNRASVKQCTSDDLREVKDGNIVEIKEKALEQDVFGILSAAGNNITVGLQEEDNMVVEGLGEDGISVLDQHKVVEQCTSDKLGVTMGDSMVQYHEVGVLEQEGITKCFDAAVEDQSVSSSVEQVTSDKLEVVKDDNFVEEREKAVVEEGAIHKLSSTKDDVTVGSQEGDVVVVAEQGKDVVYSQDQYTVVEQCASDQVRTITLVNDVQDQEVVEQEGAIFVRVATADGIAMDTQEKAIEQSAIDKSKATKDAEDKEVVMDQEGLSDKQHAIQDGSSVVSPEEGNVIGREQGEDDISVQDQDKVLEQCTSDQWRTTMDAAAAEDKEVRGEKIRLCVGYPQRPGRQNCRAYMSTGRCAYGSSCQLNHPQFKAKPDVPSFLSEQGNREVAEILELNRIGLPIREKTRNCTYYMRNGACRYGKRCCFNHPEHVLDVQLYKPTGWDDTNLPSSPHSKKSSEHANLDDISSSSEILPPNILRMLLPPQTVPPGTEEKEMKVKKDPEWSSASDESDGCCSADSFGGPLCKQEHHVDYPDRLSRKECPFLLRFGNCKFASSCHYYHPEDKYASRYPRKVPSLAEELMVYPDKPGAPECPFYMKTGACKFGAECKFHHPKNLFSSMQGPTTPKKLLDAKHHPEAKTTLQDHMDQQQNYPERPGQPECRYYMQFGKCKFLSACIFHHPKDRAPGMPECPFYMKTGTCQFGSACEFYHPVQRGSSKGGEIDDGTDYGHDYPERRGESECFHYMKHGYCKFEMNCKYHHPTDRLSKK
ncbi:hypothetical protein EJB05_05118 [Eragrostis curvula]|uniref:C3H1-type domain-containing protein n=1 Tax=Eragrostis curvula TaxID=38414 RepID=A0A5J9WCJ7_9POAL|nr:hypothetical protein EJB05_05118 [Eragrostis curvula]